MRRLGIDPGDRRVGLAISDEDGRFAFPHRTVVRTSDAQAAKDVARELAAQEFGEIVIGLPLSLDGRESRATKKARALGDALGKLTRVPIVYWDERLTTVAAERSLREQQVRGAARRDVVDQVAATLMLQGYLDAKSGGSTWEGDQDADDAQRPNKR